MHADLIDQGSKKIDKSLDIIKIVHQSQTIKKLLNMMFTK